MAPSPRTGSRQDATALPSMSSTFWAFMILASLLIAYCSQLAAGTCEIVTLDRDSSQPRRTIARQTARCACRKGQIAGTTRARPACVDARIIKTKQWCDMLPCLEEEGCDLLINRSGWTCTQPGGRIKTTTDSSLQGALSSSPPDRFQEPRLKQAGGELRVALAIHSLRGTSGRPPPGDVTRLVPPGAGEEGPCRWSEEARALPASEEPQPMEGHSGVDTNLWLSPRLSESLLFSYTFSIFNRPKRKIYFTVDAPRRSKSPGLDSGAGRQRERDDRHVPSSTTERRGGPRQRPPPHEHCGES
ncbi:PREDICTED: uncharacterized protein LOC102835595 [Chrysochloris asiatica]|uniref:Uncharacterized protein LOC102835595 n=1 Tax=Chrysochloris asiatica TaxID=185453 RepID=A0A9B0TMP7_CHRAS|nr:PREDICTED: uncharacterized protein LOC102835595 [Chrysochloris asiatica]